MSSTPSTPSAASLLSQADWVRRLSQTLVRDGSADDVAQDAWTQVLRSPPKTAGNLRGWLASLVRNSARQQARRETRLRRREQAAVRSEELPSTADLVERADLHRHLVQTVMTLDEPGRTIILLHFFEGISLRDISEQQGVPLETVRTRLRRTLTRLRQQLQDQKGDAWMALAVPVWPATGTGVATTAATVATHAVIQGAAMSLKWKLAALALLVCVAGVGLQFASSGADPAPPVDGGANVVVAAGSSVQVDQAPGGMDVGAGTRDRVQKPKPVAAKPVAVAPPGPGLFGKLIGLRRDVPWTSTVTVHAGSREGVRALVSVNADGTFHAPIETLLDDPGGIGLLLDDRRYLKVRRTLSAAAALATSKGNPLRVDVVCAALVAGRVLTLQHDGKSEGAGPKGIDGANISAHVMRRGQPVGHPVDVTRCDSQGNYELRLPDAQDCLILALPPGNLGIPHLSHLPMLGAMFRRQGNQAWLPAASTERGHIGQKHVARDIIMRMGRSVLGRVLWADGRPVVDATVRTRIDDSQATLYPPHADVRWWADGSLWFDQVEVRTDSSGHYELFNLPDRRCRIEVGHWVDDVMVHGPEVQRTVLPPARRCDFYLPASVMKISVQHGGRAIAGARIAVRGDGLTLNKRIDRGETRVVMKEGTKYRITGSAPGYVPDSFEVTAENGAMDRVLTLEKAGRCNVQLRLRGVKNVNVARFVWTRIGGVHPAVLDREVKAKRGRFGFDDLSVGRYRVDVCRPTSATERLQCVFAKTSLEIEVPAHGLVRKVVRLQQGGRLRVRAITPNGVFLAGSCKLVDRKGIALPVRFQVEVRGANHRGRLVQDPAKLVTGQLGEIVARGVNECEQLILPGRYELQVQLDGCALRRERVHIEAGGIALVEVVATPQ